MPRWGNLIRENLTYDKQGEEVEASQALSYDSTILQQLELREKALNVLWIVGVQDNVGSLLWLCQKETCLFGRRFQKRVCQLALMWLPHVVVLPNAKLLRFFSGTVTTLSSLAGWRTHRIWQCFMVIRSRLSTSSRKCCSLSVLEDSQRAFAYGRNCIAYLGGMAEHQVVWQNRTS